MKIEKEDEREREWVGVKMREWVGVRGRRWKEGRGCEREDRGQYQLTHTFTLTV